MQAKRSALPARLHADQRAAVRAAVLPGVQRALGVARHHHRHVADEGGDEALRLGELGLQAQVAPRRAAQDPLLLLPVEVLVLVHPVRNARHALGGPLSVRGRSLRHRLIIITAPRRSTRRLSWFACSCFALRCSRRAASLHNPAAARRISRRRAARQGRGLGAHAVRPDREDARHGAGHASGLS